MSRRGAFLSVSFMTLMLAASVAAQSADDPLKLVPRDALGWGVINHLTDGEAKIQKLAGAVGAPQVPLLDMAKDQLGIKNGLESKGAAGAIILPPKDKDDNTAEPIAVLFVAVSDYKAFLGNFEPEKVEKITEVDIKGQKVVIANLDGYAVIAKSDEREALEKVVASKESVADDVAELKKWLAENDASFVATSSGVKFFAAKGKAALKQLSEMFANMGEQGAQAKAGFQVYAKMLDAAEKDVTIAAAGLQVDKNGNVRLATRAALVKDGELAKAMAEIKPSKLDKLAGLPGGSFVFAGGGEMPQSLVAPLMGMSTSMMKSSPEIYGISAEQGEKLAKVSAESFRSMRGMTMVMKTGRRGDPLYSNIYGTIEVDNVDKFFATYEKQISKMQEIFKDAKEGAFKAPTIKKIEIEGKSALELEMTIPVPKVTGNPMAEKMMGAMFGPDNKSTIYMVKGDDKTIYMSFGATQEKLLQAIQLGREKEKSLGADADVAATVALLPAGAQGVALISPRGYMSLTMRMMEAMMGDNAMGLKIPQFPKTAPMGVSVELTPGVVSAELVFPADLIKAGGDYFSTMRQGVMGGGVQPQVP